MITQYEALSQANLAWENSLAQKSTAVLLPGGELMSASGPFGTVCLQEYPGNGYLIQYNHFDLLKPFSLKTSMPVVGWQIQMLLQGNPAMCKTNKKEWLLYKNQFSIFRTTGIHSLFLEQGQHINFNIFIEDSLLQSLLPFFPDVNNKIIAATNQPGLLLRDPLWISWDILEQVQSVLHCRFVHNLRVFYVDSRLKDILFNILVLLSGTPPKENELLTGEMEAIHLAEQIISTDITKHFLIPALSKKVQLNEFRFKIAFKKVYGVGPYEYLIKLRMAKAKELLKEGKSVKEVAALTGYRPSDFTVTFTHHFGITPGTLKKRNS